jgi:hypothetical protein
MNFTYKDWEDAVAARNKALGAVGAAKAARDIPAWNAALADYNHAVKRLRMINLEWAKSRKRAFGS